MPTLGKVCLSLAALGCLGSAIFACLVVEQKNQLFVKLQETQQTLDKTRSILMTTENDLAKTRANLEDLTSKLASAVLERDRLKADLMVAESKIAGLNRALQEINDQATLAQTQLRAINDVLEGQTPVEFKAEMDRMKGELAKVQNEEKALREQLVKANGEISRLNRLIKQNQEDDVPAPSLMGSIMSVNSAWNLAVLNVGLRHGLAANRVLEVYRGSSPLGQIKLISAKSETSLGSMIPTWPQSMMHAGDLVRVKTPPTSSI